MSLPDAPVIMLMAGGTGGHIFPALAVAEKLRAEGWQAHWLGAKGGLEQQLVPRHDIEMSLLPITGLRGKGRAALLSAPLKLVSAIWQARKIFRRVRPDVALGMGGFASGPGGLAARLAGCPLVIHEQNAIAGMTNRYLHKLATKTLQGFPGAFGDAAETTGNPVRAELQSLAPPEQRSRDRKGPLRLLVLGGSRGAVALNQVVPEAIARLPEGSFVVRHQAGAGKADRMGEACRQLDLDTERYQVVEFIDDMATAYKWADLVICRAGALTVAEITAVGIASVLVPYPYAVDDHQSANGRFLSNAGAARVWSQQELSAGSLADYLAGLDRTRCLEMGQRARALARPDAAGRVAEVCRQLAKGDLA